MTNHLKSWKMRKDTLGELRAEYERVSAEMIAAVESHEFQEKLRLERETGIQQWPSLKHQMLAENYDRLFGLITKHILGASFGHRRPN